MDGVRREAELLDAAAVEPQVGLAAGVAVPVRQRVQPRRGDPRRRLRLRAEVEARLLDGERPEARRVHLQAPRAGEVAEVELLERRGGVEAQRGQAADVAEPQPPQPGAARRREEVAEAEVVAPGADVEARVAEVDVGESRERGGARGGDGRGDREVRAAEREAHRREPSRARELGVGEEPPAPPEHVQLEWQLERERPRDAALGEAEPRGDARRRDDVVRGGAVVREGDLQVLHVGVGAAGGVAPREDGVDGRDEPACGGDVGVGQRPDGEPERRGERPEVAPPRRQHGCPRHVTRRRQGAEDVQEHVVAEAADQIDGGHRRRSHRPVHLLGVHGDQRTRKLIYLTSSLLYTHSLVFSYRFGFGFEF